MYSEWKVSAPGKTMQRKTKDVEVGLRESRLMDEAKNRDSRRGR